MATKLNRNLSSQKNILFIFPGPIFFPETFLKNRLELLSDHYSGTIISSSGSKHELRLGNFDVYLSYFNLRWKLISEFRLWWLCFETVWKTKNKYDLVISYDPLKTGFIAWILARLCSAKFIVEVNGVYQSEKLHYGSPIWKKRSKQLFFSWLEGFVLSQADGIKALFNGQLDTFKKETAGKKISYFFDYVNTQNFYTAAADKCILFIGHPYYIKGVDLLITAFELVQPKFPEWRLKILGWFQGPDLEALTTAARKNPSIELHPPVPNYSVPDQIATCAFLVLPSRTEAMGRVLIEAMAAGKPRIGANVDGIPTVITHGYDGLLFTPEDANALSQQMEDLMADENRRETLGLNALSRCKREFSAQRYTELCINFYGEVINELADKF